MAARLLGLIVRDTDGRWTVDYAGPLAREVLTGNESMGFFTAARAFAMGARDGFRRDGRTVLFERYSALVQYLDRCAPLWGEGG